MSLVAYAKRELEIMGEDPDTIEGILKVVEAFASCGHSGGSAPYAIYYLERLLRFQPLTPLTDDPADWNEVGDDMWQCSRNPEAFSTDGGETYYLLSERAGDDVTPIHRSEPHAQR